MEEQREWTRFVRAAVNSSFLLPGLDLLTAARSRTLLMSMAARALAFAVPAGGERVLVNYSDQLLRTHARMAGVRWYSLPGAHRRAQREDLRSVERAVLRTILMKAVTVAEAFVQDRRQQREQFQQQQQQQQARRPPTERAN
jgi:hypothetical protein